MVARLLFLLLPAALFAQTNPPLPQLNVAGTFNDWSPTNAAYRMTSISDQEFQLETFLRSGLHKFKFVFDGGWAKTWGEGPGGVLIQPGAEIPLKIAKPGEYRITLNLAEHRWKIQDAPLTVPHAVVNVPGPVELNVPITLDASESVVREGHRIRIFEFAQDTNDAVRATMLDRQPTDPQARVRLTKEGDYHFWVTVSDGAMSQPELVTLQARMSYQVVGDWTANDPAKPATFLARAGPTTFERILKSAKPADRQLLLVRNHDAGDIVTNLTVSITQIHPAPSGASRQFWRVRYDEKTKQFRCEPESLVEFTYRPKDDPNLKGRAHVETVNIAGSFNGWNSSATPMTDLGDGAYTTYLKLDGGLHQYKLVVNGDIWMQDPNADPELRADDGHQSFNSGIFIGEQGKDFDAAPTNDVNMTAVRHDPGQARYFNVVGNDWIDVHLRTLHGDAGSVALHLGSRAVPMRVTDTAFGFDFWGVNIFPENTNQTLTYSFTLADGSATNTLGPFSASLTPRFATPEWAKNVVWYQVFPERFRNGTPENDPPKTLPWRHDWYKLGPGEHYVEGKPFSNDWYGRRFGGDLQGLMEKLPYFHELGVTALYFCPIFEANSNHGYDTVDYRHISRYFGVKEDLPSETLDPSTWKWTASDKLFLEFIKKAHAQGLKVIVDGVFNHMGKGSFALQDVLTNGLKSACADWFDVTDWGPPVKYKSWDGGGWMPNFRKDPDTGVASASARQYIFNITRRWMDPNGDGDPSDGVDGWRLDVAPDVPEPFWIEWRKLVKGINSNAYITGEDWGISTAHLQGDQWDAVMNYPFAQRAIRFFIDKQRKISPSELDRQLKSLLGSYPMQVNFVMQNLYDSHDTDRLVNMVVNPDRDYDGCNRIQDGCPYDGSKPGGDAYGVMKLMATFQMTFLGAPMIWYGDEAGMFGADDPTDRKPMLWKDLQPYDNPQDAVMGDVWNYYARLIAIRNTYPALRTGLYQALLIDDANNTFAFSRTRRNEVVAVVINNSLEDQTADVPVAFPDDTRVVDVLSAPAELYDAPMSGIGFPQFAKDATVRAIRVSPSAATLVVRDSKLRLNLGPKSVAILVRQ